MENQQAFAEQLFGEALDLPREERAAFLVKACPDTPAVKRVVEALLEENDRLSGFLSDPPYKKATDTASVGLAPGTRLGRYTIVDQLGSGGMGVVYRARDEKLEREVAIKMVSKGVLASEEARRHFRREALALAKLNHSHIASVYDVGEQDGADFLVMELVQGQSLAAKLLAGPVHVNEATAIARQVAEALGEAHERGVIHRDLKPANVMITPKGDAKVLDFGLAKLLASGVDATMSVTETRGGLLGTPVYMSPEQALGKSVDARTDLWSLGVLYYESLAGRPPFVRNSSIDVLQAITGAPLPSIRTMRPELPPLAEHIVTRALEKDCDLRYQRAAEMETDLKRLLRDLDPGRASVSSVSGEMLPRAENGRAAEVAGKREMWLKIAAGVLAMLVLSVAAGVAYRWFWHGGPEKTSEKTHLNALPFTALPGWETSPAFSPDGSRIAFAWNGDPVSGGKGFDLYVKAIGSETLLRLTQHPSEMIGAAWSPDGTQIAFHRMAGTDSGIYVVPALGGLERKLHSTFTPFPAVVQQISWSPDGKWIAFTDISPGGGKDTISLLSTETWEIKRLPGTTTKCGLPASPAFSHSGEYLAYWCPQTQEEFSLYTIPLRGGPPKLILVDSRDPSGVAWSGDGKSLIITASGELDEVTVANGSVKRLDLAGLDLAASAEKPTISSDGGKLAFSSISGINAIWRRDLLHPESPPVKFAPSTREQQNAQFSPDGKHIAFSSERSGIWGVWVSNVDGSDLVQISNSQVESGNPQWSPDGKKIAFASHSVDGGEISVADLSERIPRKLVTNISHLSWPSWSRDGKWLYFMSNEVGRTGIYRCPASGGDAVALSKDPYGDVAQESFDGETVYFTSRTAYPGIKRVSLKSLPGTAFEVDGLPRLRTGWCWTLSPGGIYFVPGDAPRSVRYFDFATRKVRTLIEVDKDVRWSSLSVSPDGRWILYEQQVNEANSDIMLVDHFQ